MEGNRLWLDRATGLGQKEAQGAIGAQRGPRPGPMNQGASYRPGGQNRVLRAQRTLMGRDGGTESSRHRKQHVQKRGENMTQETQCQFPPHPGSRLPCMDTCHPPGSPVQILELAPFLALSRLPDASHGPHVRAAPPSAETQLLHLRLCSVLGRCPAGRAVSASCRILPHQPAEGLPSLASHLH